MLTAEVTAVDALQIVANEDGVALSEMEIDTTADGTTVWQVEIRQSDGSVIEHIIDATTCDVVN